MFQQLMLIGNLGSDPEMRYTPNGTPVTNFRMAVNKSWTGQDGQRHDKTTWFRVAVWGRQAESTAQYLAKGRQVMVIGEIDEPSTWTDRDGNTRASLEVRAFTVKFIGGRGDAVAGSGYGSDQMGAAGGGDQTSAVGGGDTVSDEDIPF